MGKIYLGLAMSDSMFAGDCVLRRRQLGIEEVRQIVASSPEVCCNPSHQASLDALREKWQIEVVVPDTPPKVSLSSGDSLVVMQVRGLPRLTDRHEYTADEVASATFTFARYDVE